MANELLKQIQKENRAKTQDSKKLKENIAYTNTSSNLHGSGKLPMTPEQLSWDLHTENKGKFEDITWKDWRYTDVYDKWQEILRENKLDIETFNEIHSRRFEEEILTLEEFVYKENPIIFKEYFENEKDEFTMGEDNNPEYTLTKKQTTLFYNLRKEYEKKKNNQIKSIPQDIENQRRQEIIKRKIDFNDILENPQYGMNPNRPEAGGTPVATYEKTNKVFELFDQPNVDFSLDHDPENKNKNFSLLKDDLHTFILGASGSGKTVTQIFPSLASLSIARKNIDLNYDLNNLFLDKFQKKSLENIFKKGGWFEGDDIQYKGIDLLYVFGREQGKPFKGRFLPRELSNILNKKWRDEINNDWEWYDRFRIKISFNENQEIVEHYVYAPSESILVNDVKGELAELTSGLYSSQGYKVYNFNFKDSSKSVNFNILSLYVKPFVKMVEKNIELEEFYKENPLNKGEQYKLELKIEEDTIMKELVACKQEFDKQFNLVTGLISGNTGGKDISEWVGFADTAFKGMAYYGLVSYVIPLVYQKYYQTDFYDEQTMKFENDKEIDLIDQYTVASLVAFHSRVLVGGDKDTLSQEQQKIFWKIRGNDYLIPTPEGNLKCNDRNIIAFSKLYPHIISDGSGHLESLLDYLDKPGNTKKSIDTSLKDALNSFSKVEEMSKKTDADISTIFTHKATAIFLISAWSESDMAKFPQVIISAITTNLERKASSYVNRRLPVRCNFMLDEFPNLSAIPMIDSILSLARSYGIRITIVSQSFAQLKEKYSDNIVSAIKENSGIFVYLKSYDNATNDEVSKYIGETTIKVKQTKVNRERDKNNNTIFYDIDEYKYEGRPIMLASELRTNPKWEQDVNIPMLNNLSIHTKGTKSFEMENLDKLEEITRHYEFKGGLYVQSFTPRFEYIPQFDVVGESDIITKEWSANAFKNITSLVEKGETDLSWYNSNIIR